MEISPAQRAGETQPKRDVSCRRRAVAALWRAAKAEKTREMTGFRCVSIVPPGRMTTEISHRGRCPRLISYVAPRHKLAFTHFKHRGTTYSLFARTIIFNESGVGCAAKLIAAAASFNGK